MKAPSFLRALLMKSQVFRRKMPRSAEKRGLLKVQQYHFPGDFCNINEHGMYSLLLPLFSLGSWAGTPLSNSLCPAAAARALFLSLPFSQFNPLTRIVHVFLRPTSLLLTRSLPSRPRRSRSSLLSLFLLFLQVHFRFAAAGFATRERASSERTNAVMRPSVVLPPSLLSFPYFHFHFLSLSLLPPSM